MKQPSHYYNLETKLDKNNEQLIFFNLRYRYSKFIGSSPNPTYQGLRISTGWKISKKDWDGKRATSAYVKRKGKDLNNALENIERVAYHQLSLYFDEHGEVPTPKNLKKIVFEKLNWTPKTNTDKHLIKFIDDTVEYRTKLPKTHKDHLSESTQKQYTILSNHLRQYEAFTGQHITLGNITEEIYWDIFKVLNDLNKTETQKGLAHNTVAKDSKNILAILTYAKKKKLKIGFIHDIDDFRIDEVKKSYETYLTADQIRKIIDSDVSHSKMFQHAKNYLIISCFTGLRIGDMKFIHEVVPEKIIHQSKQYNCITTRIRKSPENKEDLYSTIPLLKPVQDLLKSSNNKFPEFPSEQNLRKDIKAFLKHLEFNEPVKIGMQYYLEPLKYEYKPQHEIFTAHDCRSTFITNIKQIGITNDIIEPITHPKHKWQHILDMYDKSTAVDETVKFIKTLNSKKHSLYKYV